MKGKNMRIYEKTKSETKYENSPILPNGLRKLMVAIIQLYMPEEEAGMWYEKYKQNPKQCLNHFIECCTPYNTPLQKDLNDMFFSFKQINLFIGDYNTNEPSHYVSLTCVNGLWRLKNKNIRHTGNKSTAYSGALIDWPKDPYEMQLSSQTAIKSTPIIKRILGNNMATTGAAMLRDHEQIRSLAHSLYIYSFIYSNKKKFRFYVNPKGYINFKIDENIIYDEYLTGNIKPVFFNYESENLPFNNKCYMLGGVPAKGGAYAPSEGEEPAIDLLIYPVFKHFTALTPNNCPDYFLLQQHLLTRLVPFVGIYCNDACTRADLYTITYDIKKEESVMFKLYSNMLTKNISHLPLYKAEIKTIQNQKILTYVPTQTTLKTLSILVTEQSPNEKMQKYRSEIIMNVFTEIIGSKGWDKVKQLYYFNEVPLPSNWEEVVKE